MNLMFTKEKTSEKLSEIINHNKTFLFKEFNEEQLKKDVHKLTKNIMNAEFNLACYPMEYIYGAAFNSSQDSSRGTWLENNINDFASAINWEDIPEIKDKRITIEVPQNVLKIADNCMLELNKKFSRKTINAMKAETRKKNIMKCYTDIENEMKSSDYDSFEKVEINVVFDFVKKAPISLYPKKTISIKEIKVGGHLDSERAYKARKSSFEQYIAVYTLFRDEIINGSCDVVYSYNIIQSENHSGGVTKFFMNDEILCGKNFWVSLSGYDLSNEVLQIMKKLYNCPKVKNQMNELQNRVENQVKLLCLQKGIVLNKSKREEELENLILQNKQLLVEINNLKQKKSLKIKNQAISYQQGELFAH